MPCRCRGPMVIPAAALTTRMSNEARLFLSRRRPGVRSLRIGGAGRSSALAGKAAGTASARVPAAAGRARESGRETGCGRKSLKAQPPRRRGQCPGPRMPHAQLSSEMATPGPRRGRRQRRFVLDEAMAHARGGSTGVQSLGNHGVVWDAAGRLALNSVRQRGRRPPP
jgi:hypothetical protein